MNDVFRTIGIDIGGTNIKLAALWSDGRLIESKTIPTHADNGPEAGLNRIMTAVLELMQSQGMTVQEMKAVGMDSAGIVDPRSNQVIDSPNLRTWEQFPLADRLSDRIGLPVYLENDVNAMAFGEWKCGAGKGVDNLVCLTLGTGVGGGLILDGRLVRGASGGAGELGHVSIDPQGPKCLCPNYGCLERYIGAPYIVERGRRLLQAENCASSLKKLDPEELSPRTIYLAAEAGDSLAQQVLEETGKYLGLAMVAFVNGFNPDLIIVGGGVAGAGDWILDTARAVVDERAMRSQALVVKIVQASLGNKASLVGAALLGIERMLGIERSRDS